jgi:hypothetical protein
MTARLMAGALVALVIVVPGPASAQGLVPIPVKGLLPLQGGSRGTPPSSTPSGSTPSPNPGGVPAGSDITVATGTSLVAWIDDASVIAPGSVALSIATLRWQGAGLSQVGWPVAGMAIGLAPRLQLSATVPRLVDNRDAGGAPGGLGPMFVSGKISVLDTTRVGMVGVRLAVAPALEIFGPNASPTASTSTRWGAPVSMEIAGAPVRIFSSAGYFSGGAWFAGGGVGGHVTNRLGVSASFSRAWTVSADRTLGRSRNELSGGTAFSVTPHVSVFGSIGRTIATTDADGAGTTVSAGLSLVRLAN